MLPCPDPVEKRVAVVTGGNRGIGLEVCRELAGKGLRVILASRDAEAGKKAAASIGVESHALDVTSAESIAAFAAFAKTSLGGIDVLVNNAGATFDGFDSTVVRKTLAVNTYGAMAVTDALAPLVRDGGRIIHVSSGMGNLSAFTPSVRKRFAADAITREELAALLDEFTTAVAAHTHDSLGWPSSAYRVSKAALNVFTRIGARELASTGKRITVSAVDPGWVQTRMGGKSAPRSVAEGADTIVWLATTSEEIPSGKLFFDRAPTSF